MRHFSYHTAGQAGSAGFPFRQDGAAPARARRGDLTSAALQAEPSAPLHDTDLERAGEGAGVGSSVGAALGLVVALGATSGSWVVPGLGMELAVPLVAVLGGAGAGATLGGALGALMGWLSPDGDLL